VHQRAAPDGPSFAARSFKAAQVIERGADRGSRAPKYENVCEINDRRRRGYPPNRESGLKPSQPPMPGSWDHSARTA